MTLSIIIVNFRSQDFLQQCLISLEKKLKNISFEVILVNNDTLPLNNALISSFSFQTILIQSPTNIGFGSGCNLGARQAKGNYLFFLNPDSLLIDNSAEKAVEFLKNNSPAGIVGGKIVLLPQKKIQPWTSGAQTSLIRILFRHSIGACWKKKYPVKVDWVSGTALLIRKELFEIINGFDEKFFMYFEDQDLCLRAKKNGFQTFFLPAFLIGHYDGKSWKNKTEKKAFFYRSQDLFFQKHRKNWESFLLKTFRFIFKGQ